MRLPLEIWHLIFDYFASTAQDVATIELLGKQFATLHLWQKLVQHTLCVHSATPKAMMQRYKSNCFDLVAEQDVADFLEWAR